MSTVEQVLNGGELRKFSGFMMIKVRKYIAWRTRFGGWRAKESFRHYYYYKEKHIALVLNGEKLRKLLGIMMTREGSNVA